MVNCTDLVASQRAAKSLSQLGESDERILCGFAGHVRLWPLADIGYTSLAPPRPQSLWLPGSVLSASHVLQICNEKADLAVAQMVRRKCWHGHCRPCAHGSGVADKIM